MAGNGKENGTINGNKRGRPIKYNPERCKRIVLSAARKGKTNEQISALLNISVSTFAEWRNKYPELSEALSRGRCESVAEIEESMFNLSKGMKVTERRIIKTATGEQQILIEKEIPPDPRAAKILLSCWEPQTYQDALRVQAAIDEKSEVTTTVVFERAETRTKKVEEKKA